MLHVTWDFDGTIIDSFQAYKIAAERYCEKADLTLPSDHDLKLSFGTPDWQGFSCWNMEFILQDRHRFSIYDEFYVVQNNQTHEFTIIENIINAIELFHQNGFIQSIVTSRPLAPLLALLEHHQIQSYFPHYNTLECAEALKLKNKPAPDKLLHMIAQIGSDKDRTIMIGDTVMDIGMARNAGVEVIGVSWGIGTCEELTAAGANLIVSNAAQLIKGVMRKYETINIKMQCSDFVNKPALP